jgi:bacteriocin-like protein
MNNFELLTSKELDLIKGGMHDKSINDDCLV